MKGKRDVKSLRNVVFNDEKILLFHCLSDIKEIKEPKKVITDIYICKLEGREAAIGGVL